MKRLLVLLLATLALAAGCGKPEPVTMGSGELPAALPGDFPIPDEAEVGFFVIDRLNNRSEFVLDLPWTVTTTSEYYLTSLVGAGYVVERSEDDEEGWTITFSRGTLRGTASIVGVGESASVVISINRS